MRKSFLLAALVLSSGWSAYAATLTVTTADNANPAEGQFSFAQALAQAQSGDNIQFNIPGPGPHYLTTPTGGYPVITASNLSVEGYSQPGSVANSNPILAANNAKIKIYLDSRAGGRTVLDFDGYGTSESAILGVVGAANVSISGLGFLASITEGSDENPAIYCVSYAKGSTGGQVSGCWMGVDADGTTVAGANAGITGFRFRDDVGNALLADNVVVGVSTNANTATPAQFNVIVGMKIPVIVEGAGLRVSGNFLGVLPSGTNSVINPLLGLPNEGAVQIGRQATGTVIGTDGDGVNDANERNIFGGIIPTIDTVTTGTGYNHVIEFYGGGSRQNVVIAGNYFGVGVDGVTRFANGASIVSGLTGTSRFGSDFDGVSDALEGNLVLNHFPASYFPAGSYRPFVDGPGADSLISLRGNNLVGNWGVPFDPTLDNGDFITNYFARVILDPTQGLRPVLTNATASRLEGTIPGANTNDYPVTALDVYLADPATFPSDPDHASAVIQGGKYLGTFIKGGAEDSNPDASAFSFSSTRLGLAVGAKITVTANYSLDAAGTHDGRTITTSFSDVTEITTGTTNPGDATLNITLSGTSATLTWTATGYSLQSATSVAGPWTAVAGAATGYTTPVAIGTKFFRLAK